MTSEVRRVGPRQEADSIKIATQSLHGTAYERLREVFEGRGSKIVRSGRGVQVQCPAHEDDDPSLSITPIEGSVLIHCYAGCRTDDVLAALGWTMADLYDDREATYRYDDGRIVCRSYDDTGAKKFPQSGNKNGRPTLYRLGRVKEAVAAGQTIYLVEGEKDVHAIEAVGGIATTAPMGAKNFSKCDVTPLTGAAVVAVVDRDEAGQGWASQVQEALDGKAATVEFREAKHGKDAAEHIAAGYGLGELEPVPAERPRFMVRTFADIEPRTSTWLLPGVLPDDELVVFIGEEGIGKGLFSVDVIARVTRAGHNVLIIATEDDYESTLRPRLDVAGADVSRCIFMISDADTLQGQPRLPSDLLEVRQVIDQEHVRLVYIDPWVSSVSGGLRLRDTQDARRAINPLLQLARAAHCSVLAVAHPNRGEGDLRARVGLSAVLRQAARLLLYAIEPPDDDTRLIVGIEKANAAERAPAAVYRKGPRRHPSLAEPVWAVEEIPDAARLTIRQWHDRYRTDRDHRTTDRWPAVLAVANQGLVQRADIIAIYEESGSSEAAANKAIGRWINNGRLVQRGSGVYELGNG